MVAAAIIGSTVVGAAVSSNASSRAARAQEQGSQNSIAESQRQYDQTRSDFAPWRTAGSNALARLTAASSGDRSSFQTSPGYGFRRTEGQRDIGSSFAARGGAASGNALRALTEFNQNIASSEFGNWWDQQAGLAGVGQSATGQTAAAGQNAANNISAAYGAAGDARASGLIGQGNAWGNALNTGLNSWLLYKGGYFKPPGG